MHWYRAFGLSISSSWPLPDLLPLPEPPATPDVSIEERPVEPSEEAKNQPVLGDGWFNIDAHGTSYVYPGIASFLVSHGRSIAVDPAPSADERMVRHLLLGPIFATLLWQRQLLTLHAAVLTIAGRTVAFMAASGEGKSTLASALYARGHTMLSDDIAAIPWQEPELTVLPGYPRMKVYPEVLRALGVDPDARPLVHGALDKRAFMADGVPTEPRTLSAVYVLTRGEQESVELLPKARGMLTCMAQAYRPAQFIAHVGAQALMKMCARVAEHAPVFSLSRPRDLERLVTLAGFVEAQVAGLP